ncbi:ribose-5-phosphate isomerase RpiA [Sphingomonas sp.]|jgi:ribose 5-phosphate isomerase A|uniref:ribose-5-phosphate isomerase RpiA n=1 Tax=Sphingomonas sp. TaxID=28214 RepID=UPI002E33B5F5|nr:ribose-5-phosphate isomerase RpiA [Sphingomonas sp.]HEX4693421.1 ribose-5-phosphate isomerase RpiA [Sphingomonas sp.]
MQDDDKRLAAEAALGEISPGMRVGIGTGSTMAFAISAIGSRLPEWPATSFYATSQATWRAANAAGIPIGRFADVAELDLAIDGADEIDPQLRAIKGGGGAMLREKIVAASARRMVVVADGSKHVAALGKAPVPVEVLPFARSFVEARVVALGAKPVLRITPQRAYRTNQGNLILDCNFGIIADPATLAAALASIPGLLGHGLFLTEVDAAYVAVGGIVTKMERPAA